jgi:hypothetical protein
MLPPRSGESKRRSGPKKDECKMEGQTSERSRLNASGNSFDEQVK